MLLESVQTHRSMNLLSLLTSTILVSLLDIGYISIRTSARMQTRYSFGANASACKARAGTVEAHVWMTRSAAEAYVWLARRLLLANVAQV